MWLSAGLRCPWQVRSWNRRKHSCQLCSTTDHDLSSCSGSGCEIWICALEEKCRRQDSYFPSEPCLAVHVAWPFERRPAWPVTSMSCSLHDPRCYDPPCCVLMHSPKAVAVAYCTLYAEGSREATRVRSHAQGKTRQALHLHFTRDACRRVAAS